MMRRLGGAPKNLQAVPVPKMGKTAWGTVFGWRKKPGEFIKKGDRICQIERGQVTDDVWSPFSGTIMECCAGEEESVRVGANLCVIDVLEGGGGSDAASSMLNSLDDVAPDLHSQSMRSMAEYQNSALFGALLSAAAMGGSEGKAKPAMPKMSGLSNNARSPTSSLANFQSSMQQIQQGSGLPSSPALSSMQQSASSLMSMQKMQSVVAAKLAAAKTAGADSLLQKLSAGSILGAPGTKLEIKKSGVTGSDLWNSQGVPGYESWAGSAGPSGGFPSTSFAAATSPSASSKPDTAGLGSEYWKDEYAKKASSAGWEAQTLKAALPAFMPAAKAKAAAAAPPKDDFESLKCHLHKKNNNKCKFCKKYYEAKTKADEEANAKKQAEKSSGPVSEQTFNCSPLLRERIVGCSYYKSLFDLEDVEGLIEEIKQFVTISDTLDVYRTSVEPSCFMCCIYRLFTLNAPELDLRRLLDNEESVMARCVGLLYMRYVVPPDQLFERMEEFLLDDEELNNVAGIDASPPSTIGEFAENLLLKDKYFQTPLPRVPPVVRRKLEELVAPMSQYRKRALANKRVFRNLREHLAVEVCDNGTWRQGKAVDVLRQISSRLRVRVQIDDGPEYVVHIGKVVILERQPLSRNHGRERSRSRSPVQGAAVGQDWSRMRGKTDAELIDELRERGREDAVCGDRKGYAKRLPRFESGLATNREKGPAESKLIEECEGYGSMPGRRRQGYDNEMPPEEYDADAFKRTSEEDESRKRRMQDIMQKYGSTGRQEHGAGKNLNEIEGPDTLRLG